MASDTDHPNSEKITWPAHDLSNCLTLWLNYENKQDQLRSQFLTIAGLLFALQSAIFVLMLDKIILSDKALNTAQTSQAKDTLIVLSVLILIFFIVISFMYVFHINRNFDRANNVVNQCSSLLKDLKTIIYDPRKANTLRSYSSQISCLDKLWLNKLNLNKYICIVSLIHLCLFVATMCFVRERLPKFVNSLIDFTNRSLSVNE